MALVGDDEGGADLLRADAVGASQQALHGVVQRRDERHVACSVCHARWKVECPQGEDVRIDAISNPTTLPLIEHKQTHNKYHTQFPLGFVGPFFFLLRFTFV